jgi:deoxyribodipyrimidine photo-lyase
MRNTKIRKTLHDRATVLKKTDKTGLVLYWMNRDIRLLDNPALSFAQSLSLERKQPLIILFGINPNKHNQRQITFLIDSLKLLEKELFKLNIPLVLILIKKYKVASLVTDFSPIRSDKSYVSSLISKIDISYYRIDAHNTVPFHIASNKREYAAYTIRPKINNLFNIYNEQSTKIIKHPFNESLSIKKIEWEKLTKKLTINSKSMIFKPGSKAAIKQVDYFIEKKLSNYNKLRNDPNEDYQSNLSAYLHFGLISSRTVYERVKNKAIFEDSTDKFFDELIIRKELSDNFCFYTENYDSIDAFPSWAKKTLEDHRDDPRKYIYNRDDLEYYATHDPLWNAAQKEMVTTGKMHGYMRMYWAKKILEWSISPEHAMETAIYLNDKYQLDGNDPNGYAGIAWSIGGVHDRPWFEREIFGKVRYMSYNGCKNKFDVKKYITKNNAQLKLEIT